MKTMQALSVLGRSYFFSTAGNLEQENYPENQNTSRDLRGRESLIQYEKAENSCEKRIDGCKEARFFCRCIPLRDRLQRKAQDRTDKGER